MDLATYQEFVDGGRVIYLTGIIDGEQATCLRRQLNGGMLKDHPKDELAVLLSTSGGSSMPGIAIYNELRALATGRKLWMVCQSAVHSMGTYIMLAVPREQRVTFPLTSFYCHWGRLKWGYETEGFVDTHKYRIKEYQAAIEDYEREMETFTQLLIENTEVGEVGIRDLLANPRHIYENEAVELGLVQNVLR